MTRGIAQKLGLARKALLVTLAIAAVVGPIALGLLHAPPIRAQSPAAGGARLEFAAASIKPNTSGTMGSLSRHNAGGLTATNGSLQSLITMAYGVKRYQLSGAPGWLNSEKFDIVAKAPFDSSREQLMRMLQSLLEDRFKLAVHHESKVLSGYALVVANSGPKLHESKAEEGMTNGTPGNLTAQRTTISQLAGTLARWFDRPISDMTGLQGFYDIELKWAPEERETMKPGEDGALSTAPADVATGPTIFTALQEQLGLKLEARKVPVDILVIDHVERTPSEN